MRRNARRNALLGLTSAWLIGGWAPQVTAENTLELENAVFQEIDVTDAAGKTHRERVPAVKVVPGGEVIYVISYRNAGSQPATDVVIVNPIPSELAYQPEPGPSFELRPEVSVDAGQTFGVLAQLKVKGDDGKLRAAQGSDVTHVRWRIDHPLRAGEQGSVSYRAVLE